MSIHFFPFSPPKCCIVITRRYSTLFFFSSMQHLFHFVSAPYLLSLFAVDPMVKYRLRRETGLHSFFLVIIVQTALVKITSDYSSLKEYHSNYGIIFKELYLDLTDTRYAFEIRRGSISIFWTGKMCK